MKLLLLCQIAIQLAALTRGNILVQLKFTVCNYYYAAQVVPTSYSFSVTDAVSVHGSSVTGQCSSFTNSSGTLNCTDPSSSVLFDGHIPTLTGLDGEMWASQLLTMSPLADRTQIAFDFSGSINLIRVEVVMFNCPQWGIGTESLVVLENMISIGSIVTDNITSCEYLVSTCLIAPFSSSTVSLRFSLLPTSLWVHLAEVTFHTDSSACPPDTTVTGAIPLTSATSSLRETTTATETQTTSLATTAITSSLPISPQTETTSSSKCVPLMV